jgi:hypothetical protein
MEGDEGKAIQLHVFNLQNTSPVPMHSQKTWYLTCCTILLAASLTVPWKCVFNYTLISCATCDREICCGTPYLIWCYGKEKASYRVNNWVEIDKQPSYSTFAIEATKCTLTRIP